MSQAIKSDRQTHIFFLLLDLPPLLPLIAFKMIHLTNLLFRLELKGIPAGSGVHKGQDSYLGTRIPLNNIIHQRVRVRLSSALLTVFIKA